MFGIPTEQITQAAIQLTTTLRKVDLLIDDIRVILTHVNAVTSDVHAVMDRVKGQPSALRREGESNDTSSS